MLQDYNIKRTESHTSKLFAVVEFILVLLIIQGVLLLFSQDLPESEAVQFRILANSNTAEDQQVKRDIQQQVEPLIQKALGSAASERQLTANLQALEPEIARIAQEQAKGLPIQFGRQQALIPPKRIGFMIQRQGVYDAYVLTIGSGRGDNWWCSLFPNVCFPEEEETKQQEEEPVKFFVWEWITSWFA